MKITVRAPEVAYPGGHPHQHYMRAAARNLREGYEVGGSNVKAAIASLLERVATAMDETPDIPTATCQCPGDDPDRCACPPNPVIDLARMAEQIADRMDGDTITLAGGEVWLSVNDQDAPTPVVYAEDENGRILGRYRITVTTEPSR
jgi:hypothetical protein